MKILILKKQRLITIVSLLFRLYFLNKRGKKDAMYNLVCNELLRLGGVYIKFLQGLILQSWSVQRWKSDNKLDIFENVKSKPVEAQTILENTLGAGSQRLTGLSKEPFAVGSFGHVYKARLDGDKQVIVKVLSNEIKDTLKFDLRLLKLFWYVHLRTVRFDKSISVKSLFKDFRKQTLREIDYPGEAQAAHNQYLLYRKNKKLVIPKTYLELCNDQVIVQDYVDGLSVANLLKLKEADKELDFETYVKEKFDSDLVKQLQTLVYEIIWGAFHHPTIMGDPHPGNVIIMKDNRIGLIDFGIMSQSAKYPASLLKFIKAYNQLHQEFNLEEFFVASLQFFGRDLYLSLEKLSQLIPKDSKEKISLNYELAKIMRLVFETEYPDEDIANLVKSPKAMVVFDRIANKNNRFGFKLKVNDGELLRTMVTITGLVDALDIYPQVMDDVYTRVIERVETRYPDLKSLNEVEISHNQALNIVFAWLERVANQDPALFKDIMRKLHLKSEMFKDRVS